MKAVRFSRGMNRRGSPGDAFRHLSISLILTLIILGLFQFEWDALRGIITDLIYRTQWWSRPEPSIVMIGYDQKSSFRYSGSTKIPVQELVLLLEKLKDSEAKAIGIFAPINEKNYSDDEIAALARAMPAAPAVVIGYTDDESLGKASPEQLRPAVRYLPGMISRDNFSYGADGVTRRVMISIDGYPTAYAELARLARNKNSADHFRNEQSYMTSQSRQTYIHWQGEPPVYRFHPSRDVAEGAIAPSHFKDKIVLIGNVFPTQNPRDYILTPYSRTPWKTLYMEGVAQSLATLIEDRGVAKTSFLVNLIISLFVGLLTVNLVLILSPLRGIGIMFLELGLLFVIGWVTLFLGETHIDLAHPAVIVCVAYYLVIPYRLLSEYRSRWHYQEKSELMAQLEQLKSNFLSLVSHDLKTPIARIQGSAELLAQSSRLDEKEKKSLSGIVQTTEELSEYVQTVLDLTRIESAKMPLQKTSKDINVTLREVAENKQALAAEKNITIATEFEPIFSFKFDQKLIHRVLSNLVENAIKYSPEGTTILLSSKEDGDWIRVNVTDQGKGIPEDERTKVFEKFYRGRNAQENQAKGSGLGLYLVKYFVELHKGFVELKSEMGKGSTFTVSLPV